jgi:two-component system, cell cycle sensor histidine kinase and response regulator CckA
VTFAGVLLLLALLGVLLGSRRRLRASERRHQQMMETAGEALAAARRSEKLVADALGYAQTLLEASPVGVVTFRASGEAIEANSAAAAMVGGTIEQLKATNFRLLQSWKDSGLLDAALAALETRSEQRVEAPLSTSYGRHLWVYCNFVPFQFAGEWQLLALLSDVSERRRTEAANALFRELLDRSNDIIEVFDPATGRLIDVNQRACQELGYSRAEILSLRASDLHPAADDALLGETLDAFRKPGSLPVAGVHRRKDGSTFPVEMSISHVSLDREYAVAMVRDITRERLLKSQLHQAQKMETIGQFAKTITHDFNNVLSIVMTYAGVLTGDLDPADPRREDAEEIERAAGRAAALTRQLLAFSRSQLLEPRVLDLNQVVSGMEKMLRRLLSANIELIIERAPELGSVKADAGQIEQLILNMAANARDAMPGGGRLIIETANVQIEEAPEEEGIPRGAYVLLAVSDTGLGMDAETRRRAFEPFFTTKEKGRGTGLGLSTCYGIVKQSGGYITVYSEPGKGTVFKTWLPRVDARPDVLPATGAAELRGSETILLVEDDDQVRAAARRVLEGNGYQVRTASDLESALESCHEQGPPDLLLTDVVMPRGDGLELAQRAKQLFPGLKLVLMSGHTDQSLFDRGLSSEGFALLRKPFTKETLGQKVREVLDGVNQ